MSLICVVPKIMVTLIGCIGCINGKKELFFIITYVDSRSFETTFLSSSFEFFVRSIFSLFCKNIVHTFLKKKIQYSIEQQKQIRSI